VNIFLTSKGLLHVVKLIGCDIEDLKLTLSTRKMKFENDNIVKKKKQHRTYGPCMMKIENADFFKLLM